MNLNRITVTLSGTEYTVDVTRYMDVKLTGQYVYIPYTMSEVGVEQMNQVTDGMFNHMANAPISYSAYCDDDEVEAVKLKLFAAVEQKLADLKHDAAAKDEAFACGEPQLTVMVVSEEDFE